MRTVRVKRPPYMAVSKRVVYLAVDALYGILNVEGSALHGEEVRGLGLDVPAHFTKVRAALAALAEEGLDIEWFIEAEAEAEAEAEKAKE